MDHFSLNAFSSNCESKSMSSMQPIKSFMVITTSVSSNAACLGFFLSSPSITSKRGKRASHNGASTSSTVSAFIGALGKYPWALEL
eukprot:CAMPEP_0204647214 /NCGR_PEP_ID=MMETSP0718-20130828/5755_1 /ASSEMBLY_ACC=CAM_ASM_000674 /TAXON_ID=230516 /ORGANISM="Chaetoceros curvisetus" /LENGTH=85 /DNA_ID=CAMNT_0051669715 /DNA_START=212 /DNA_END=469 /DNA_ORIENTATION=+